MKFAIYKYELVKTSFRIYKQLLLNILQTISLKYGRNI